MRRMSTDNAKASFGQLLDTVRREPVVIEEHGHAVAVMLSKDAFDALEATQLERLRAEVQKGIDAIDQGDFVEVDEAGLGRLVDDIMTTGRERAVGR